MADAKTEKQKVKEITDKLEEGLKELFESEMYKRYLSTMSKFHNYSANNIQLIAMQRPDATLVAGYQAWQKNFERHVNKGERAIRILAPAPYKIKEERDKLDPDTGEMMFDENGMPQKEEVEIKIAAFRVVSVFDIGQTDGKPLPELEAKELLSTVEGYEDFKQAVMNVAPVSIGFEDIPGDSKGYFSPVEKRIAVQENMAESQTLKTMIHETAHSMLHDKEVNRSSGLDVPVKGRNTKEVEAESIAFTVCQHFGIDTSDYSFGYIAGWSTDRDMKELKSSLDTIRRAASELITGIEGQLQELQRDREMMQEQEKESLLLIQKSDLSEYSLVSVKGMDAEQIMEALYVMNDDDRLNIAAYLESRGAWTMEIANQDTKEFEEYHLDVRYITDTNEVIDLKAEMEMNEKAKEPIGANDVILKITHSNGFEVERITNKTPEEVQEIMGALANLSDKGRKSIHRVLEIYDAEFIPIIVSGGRNTTMPQFNDFEIDLDKKEITMMSHRSPSEQAEGIINRLEFAKTAFSDDERSLIVNYAFKLNDMEKTRELAEHIYYEEAEGNQGAALAVIDAQAEIDALPDPEIGLSEMEEYGYTWEEMLPLTKGTALEFFDHDLTVYLLHEDGSETMAEDRKQITGHDGIFGIEKGDWENEKELRTMQAELEESRANREAQLLYGSSAKYGIYQLKDSPELRDFHFAGTKELLKRGILSDDFKEIQPENYNLIYVGELSDIRGQTQGGRLNAIYEKFNIDHPMDYKGHSLSISDIVVLHEDGKNSTHFVDSYGRFTELPNFMRELEGIKEQETDQAENGLTDEEKQFLETDNAPLVAKKFLAWDEIEDLGYCFFEDGYIDKFKPSEKALYGDGMVPESKIYDIARRMQGGEDIRGELAKALIGDYERVIGIGENNAVAVFGNDAVTVTFGNAEKQISYEEMGTAFLGLIESEYKEIEQARAAEEQEEEIAGNATSGQNVHDQERIEDGDEIIDFGDEREQVIAEMKQSLEGSKEASGQDVQKQEVTLTVAECGEFHNLGEFHENISTVDEAIAIWKQIPSERMYGVPAIGINIHTPGTKKIDDVGIDVLSGNHFDLDILEYIPEIKGSPQAMEVIAELIAKLPEMEIYDKMPQEIEEKVWEKRMPDLTSAEQLAVELDRFAYDYDTALYRNSSRNMTENVSELAEAIEQRDTHDMMLWLADVITDGTEPEETKRATELLEKLTEYKPLAKIEEMEEANYNMVDNVLNNGAGEKAQKEENKKEQESPAAKTSLKARLAEKKELVSGQGKDHESQEKLINSQREM